MRIFPHLHEYFVAAFVAFWWNEVVCEHRYGVKRQRRIEWNKRRRTGEKFPSLRRAELYKSDLRAANLQGIIVSKADLYEVDLRMARLAGAVLSEAHLDGADLTEVDLRGAVLARCDFGGATFVRANLSGADLRGADLTEAKLSGAELPSCKCLNTAFTKVDLSDVKGLETVQHHGPSTISIDTLLRVNGNIPEEFLRGCGVPDAFVEYLPSLIGSMNPIQFYSCFISHSSVDKDFARRLFVGMRDQGTRVWLDEEHMKAGRELHPQIDEAIRIHDKLLLVLSESSMKSTWVATEIRRARSAEKREGRRKLFPIRITDFDRIRAWELPDSSGEDLAAEVRKFFIPDFTNWKDHDSFESAFARLLRDLKSEESTGVKPA